MTEWAKVALGELLTPASDPVRVEQDRTYPNFGIYSFGRGLFAKPPISGMQTSASRLYRVRGGNFIYSRLFAFEGSYGLVDEAFDGCYVSNEYPSFTIDRSRLEPRFLLAYFRYPRTWQAIAMGSKGVGSRRIRVQPDKVLAHCIPLPPLAEQRAIVARLDALAEKTRQVEENLEAVERGSLRLLVTMATRRDLSDEARTSLGWRRGCVAELAALSRSAQTVVRERSYPNVGILSFAKGLFQKAPIDGMATSATTLYRISAGQFIYSRLFAFEGAYALVPHEFDGYFVSNEFPTFEIDNEVASAKFLMTLFLTESDWHALRSATKGVGDRRLRIQPEHLLARPIWIPPREDIARVDAMFDHHSALKARHAAIREANAALLPATLERVFEETRSV